MPRVGLVNGQLAILQSGKQLSLGGYQRRSYVASREYRIIGMESIVYDTGRDMQNAWTFNVHKHGLIQFAVW